jgi:endonuclease YncB( thermonuclease family)
MKAKAARLSRGALVFAAAMAPPAIAVAAGDVDPAYVKSLAAPGKAVLVVEYYDGQNRVAARKGFASPKGFQADATTGIEIDRKVSLRLYGVEPCDGDVVNRQEGFSGSCADYASAQLKVMLKSSKVVLCRAFVSEENASRQDVTCFGYVSFPGSLETIDNFEEQLLSVGAVRLTRKADGSPMRPDLVGAEKIGRQGYGIWADPRTKP